MVGAQLRHAPGECDSGRVEMREPPLGVGRVDRHREGIDHLTEASLALAREPLGLPALGDIVEAIDGADDLPAFVFQRLWVGNDIPSCAVGSLDDNFRVVRIEGFATQHARHRALVVGHEPAVGVKYLE